MNKLHHCPNCNHKYSYWQKLKKIYFRLLWKSWKCENCGANLKIEPKRRVVNAIIFTLAVFALFLINDTITNKLLSIFIATSVIIILSLILVFFDKIKLSDPK